MPNPEALTLEHPLDMQDARRATRRLAELRRAAEQEHERLVTTAAEAEADYRKAYAKAFIVAEGTAAEREAKARADVADLSYKRDIAVGMSKLQTERLRGLEGERAMLKSLLDWSARLAIDGRERRDGQ